jgi:hypothetical protein
MRRHVLIIVLLAASAVGCQIRPDFVTGYQVMQSNLTPPPNSDLAVTAFREARPPRHYELAGRMFLLYVPLVPYATIEFERTDENVAELAKDIEREGAHGTMPAAPPFETYAYPVSVPRAIADDLAASHLFSSVRYVGDGPTGDARYVLRGSVVASPLRSSATSYLLGMPGVLLWLLPLPMQKTTASITVDLELTDTTSGAVIWRDTIACELSRTATMYANQMVYGSGGSFSFNLLPLQSDVTTVDRDSLFSWHFEALRRAMETAKPDLARALAASRGS